MTVLGLNYFMLAIVIMALSQHHSADFEPFIKPNKIQKKFLKFIFNVLLSFVSDKIFKRIEKFKATYKMCNKYFKKKYF